MSSGFVILDSAGKLKLSSLGTGSALPDPVTVPHGGTGLTSYAKGDILYASADGVLSKLAVDSSAAKVLSNTGSSDYLTPAWSNISSEADMIPRPPSRKIASAFATTNATTNQNIWSTSESGAATFNDSTAAWRRFTTGTSAGNQAGFLTITSDWCWIDHLPLLKAIIRTGPNLAAVRLFFFISNVTSGSFPTNADDQSALKGVGIRYSTVASDPGWVPWTSDGTTQTVGSTKIADIAAGTVYSLTIDVTSTTSVRCKVNDSAYQTLTIGAGALGAACRVQLCVTTTEAAAKIIYFNSIYGECN